MAHAMVLAYDSMASQPATQTRSALISVTQAGDAACYRGVTITTFHYQAVMNLVRTTWTWTAINGPTWTPLCNHERSLLGFHAVDRKHRTTLLTACFLHGRTAGPKP